MNRRQLTRLLLVAFALLVNAVPARAETVLRIVMNSDLKILDPIWNTAFVIRDHGYMIYDTLFATDAERRDQAADGRPHRDFRPTSSPIPSPCATA